MSIPRRIIQTARDRTFSTLEKAAIQNVRLLHPDWEYLFFDDVDIRRFVAAEFPQHQQTFDRFRRTIQRIDFFRYLAVFRLGGFYLDLDVFLAESLDPLCCHGAVFPFEELTLNGFLRKQHAMDWEIGNYAFGATAGHPYLEAVIANCIRSQSDPEWTGLMMSGIPSFFRSDFEVLNTTGPGQLSRTLAECPEATGDLEILFPEDVCAESSWHQFGQYGTHLMAASWRTKAGFLHGRLMRLWESWTRARTRAWSVALGPHAVFLAPQRLRCHRSHPHRSCKAPDEIAWSLVPYPRPLPAGRALPPSRADPIHGESRANHLLYFRRFSSFCPVRRRRDPGGGRRRGTYYTSFGLMGANGSDRRDLSPGGSGCHPFSADMSSAAILLPIATRRDFAQRFRRVD